LSQKQKSEDNVKIFKPTYKKNCGTQHPKKGEPQKGNSEQASPTGQMRHNSQRIIYKEKPGQRNGQCPFQMASKQTCGQGQKQPPMGKSRGASATMRHPGTIKPENATLVEVTTSNTPVQERGNPHEQSQHTETPRMAQQIGTLNIEGDNDDLPTDDTDTGTTQEVQLSDYRCEI
jgi:hypothetical protein